MKVEIYFNNQLLDDRHSDGLGKTMLKLNMTVGDTFTAYPFNHFNDEKTDYKESVFDYQLKKLEVYNIERVFVNDWNGAIKTTIKYYIRVY